MNASRNTQAKGPSPDRLKALDEWLDKNVRCSPTPALVTLSAFQVNWKNLSGSFALELDGTVLEDRFDFGLDVAGRPHLFSPMFVSPLGVPASFPAIHLTSATEAAILEALRSFLPSVMPLGRDPRTGKELTMLTPMEERVVEPEKLRKAMRDLEDPTWTISAGTSSLDLG